MKIATAGLLLAACAAPTHWEREGATDRDYRMELAQCRVTAASIPDPIIGGATIRNCLIGKGWEQRPR